MMMAFFERLFKDHFNDFVAWSQAVPIDTPFDDVRAMIPSYIEVAWHAPQSFGTGLLYPVLRIKGHRMNDFQCFLGFVDGKYAGAPMQKV